MIESLRKYYRTVVSIRWIDSLLSHDSSVAVNIKYVGGLSLSNKALASFMVGLSRHTWKADDWIGEILRVANQIAFFDLEEAGRKYSRWLAFPNGEMILWHHSGDGVLDLDLDPYPTTEMFGQKGVFVKFSQDLRVIDAP
jgi:hypothetical protein